ncbi:hypothetical protein F5Y07DRAFT_202613 [Xylaria sp. FL0933]|nr:hypothetical protein F5Y07DRAFT_202613 [Xylaria sp. FL0933]
MQAHQGKTGYNLVLGDFHAMSALWNVIPEIVARLYGYGTYEKMEDGHFFLCSFHELTDDIPEIDEFPALVAEMHRRLDGKFRFPYEVYGGRLPHFSPVTDSWEETFPSGLSTAKRILRCMMRIWLS